jgi:hypothetical protein
MYPFFICIRLTSSDAISTMHIESIIAILTDEQLNALYYSCTAELEYRAQRRESAKCTCGSGYCPDDNVTYPCFCAEVEDELPF